MFRSVTLAVFGAALVLAAPVPAWAQSGKTVDLPADQIACLVEHKEKYLSVPRGIVFFTPELCPALSKQEVLDRARTVQNSANGADRAFKRLSLNKKRFRCLYEKLEAYVAELEAEDVTEDPIEEGAIVADADAVEETTPQEDAPIKEEDEIVTISFSLECAS